MFLILSKILPLFVYPLGLACLLLALSYLYKRESRWPRRLSAAALLLLLAGSNRLAAMALVRSLEQQYLPPSEIPEVQAIVLLGGGTRPQLFPRQSTEIAEAGDRLFAAARLYHEGKAPVILVSGGWAVTSVQEGPTGGESMTAVLGLLGVPEGAIWQESLSRNTYENGIFSREMLIERGIDGPVLLVTSATHMPRSVRIFEKLGVDVVAVPVDYLVPDAEWRYAFNGGLGVVLYNLLPSAGALNMMELALKEYVGIVVYWLRGYL